MAAVNVSQRGPDRGRRDNMNTRVQFHNELTDQWLTIAQLPGIPEAKAFLRKQKRKPHIDCVRVMAQGVEEWYGAYISNTQRHDWNQM